MEDLRGKLVLLDFWTYCCINCQHVLPQLRKLEERFPNELVVIGVHSGKFPAEGNTFNLRQAVMRHDLRHPVVNDRGFVVWRAYAVRAWPTLVLVDPDGIVIGVTSGEVDAGKFGDGIERIIQALDAHGKLDRTPLPLLLEKQRQPETLLSFPAGIFADPEHDRLFVADTEHHRVLQFGLMDRKLQAAWGSGEPGLRDGVASKARFQSPRGMALVDGALLVADTENHAIRRISLETGGVSLLAGTGRQAQPWPVETIGRETALNSPWDLERVENSLFIAMAGSHQIWRMDLITGWMTLFAGDGREALKDGPPAEARLAQPSALSSDGERLWWVDSESSSLRSAPLKGTGETETWAGEGLFDFGDVEGDRRKARLQHPLGVTCLDGLVYVADSYNHRLKLLDPGSGLIRRFSGNGEPGLQDGDTPEEACYWEPGAVHAAGDRLYVADTNNCVVRVVDRGAGAGMTMDLHE
jgi:thiol-disulfide isomerase/thioredoxin